MQNNYNSIHYLNVREINYLKDIQDQDQQQSIDNQNFNSDKQCINSIAQKLYKKIVRQGYIEKAQEFAIPQPKKKNDAMYDLSDKWINDQEVFTESEAEKTSNDFSQFKALSDVSIEEFYKQNGLQKQKKTPEKGKQVKPRPLYQLHTISQLFKNPLTVVKFGELKKKIQSNIRSDHATKDESSIKQK